MNGTATHVRRRAIDLLGQLDALRPASPRAGGMSRLGHCLQTAARARTAGRGDDVVVAALLHDVGHLIPHCDHAGVAADLLRPYVDEQTCLLLRCHALLARGEPRPAALRDAGLAAAFVEWDRVSWDPDYPTPPLERFLDALERVIR